MYNAHTMYAQVVFDIPISQHFTYFIPEEFRPVVQKGTRVYVPFGRRNTTGYVVGLSPNPPEKIQIKAIVDVLDPIPLITSDVFQLCEWIADYYLCGLGEVLRMALPPGLSLEEKKTVRLVKTPQGEELENLKKRAPLMHAIVVALSQAREMQVHALQRKLGRRWIKDSLLRLQQAGFIELQDRLTGRASHEKRQTFIKLCDGAGGRAADVLARAPKMRAILEALQRNGGSGRLHQILKETRASRTSANRLARLGMVEIYERRIERDYYGDLEVPPAPKLVLTAEQQQAVERILQAMGSPSRPFLIHGVTGSGKTQVYIEAIRQTLNSGKGAILLVPEIALTPQIVRRFRSEFQDRVAVLHSRMSAGERYDAWLKIREGRARVVVGPRSAVFAPVQNLGIIVVDEEHETSYKQTDNAPRYHARDVAIVRAKLVGALVVLGSATPSMESYYNARLKKYTLIEMRKRIDEVPMPRVKLVNMARAPKVNTKSENAILSEILVERIRDKLAKREQIIILQNRRGFSSAVQCRECGHVQMCPNCNISMSYHLKGRKMRCHYCNETQNAPDRCPQCYSVEIQYKGIGTQRVEKEFEELFPGARIVRMDLDTTRGRRAHDRILEDFARYRYDILIGTQMIAKGLDFPRVTLVGVISADTGLYLPDFRASEKTFQLLTQVAGRAGRKDREGEVIIQTYSPGHMCLQCTKDHDFKRFFNFEIQDRRVLNYPPFGRLALIQFRHTDRRKALEAGYLFFRFLEPQAETFQILGPAPSPISRLQSFYRFQILLKNDRKVDPSAGQMREAVRNAMKKYREHHKYSRVKVSIDIDPLIIL